MKMTGEDQLKVVSKTVERIKQVLEEGDKEAAHIAEDELYLLVLNLIASGAENPQELAIEALKASEIEYSRWYS